ncbi:hypothetical protein CYMTET_11183, partial [Cymbomonas tetramitiformis]
AGGEGSAGGALEPGAVVRQPVGAQGGLQWGRRVALLQGGQHARGSGVLCEVEDLCSALRYLHWRDL